MIKSIGKYGIFKLLDDTLVVMISGFTGSAQHIQDSDKYI